MKSVAQMFIFGLFAIMCANGASAKGGCPTVSSMAEHLNEKTREYCGPGKIDWDLTDFVPDGIVCESRQQGLNLIERVVQDLCEAKIEGDDITKKLSRIKVTAYLGTETDYKILGKDLIAKVPIKEAPILTKWNEELAKLKTFLRTSTGLSLATKEEREKLKADAERATETKKRDKDREKERALNDEKRKKAELEQQAKTTLREKTVSNAQAKLQQAVATYQKKAKEIWSTQDSTPEGMEKKKQEAEQALQELNQAQAEFQKEISGIK